MMRRGRYGVTLTSHMFGVPQLACRCGRRHSCRQMLGGQGHEADFNRRVHEADDRFDWSGSDVAVVEHR
jgi:hypothetical protein